MPSHASATSRADSRPEILDAATSVFSERGFAGASLSEIRKRAGVAQSLIHHHFGSKDLLWREVKRAAFATYYERQVEILRGAQAQPELMRDSMRAYFKFLAERPYFVRLLGWMQLEGDEDCDEMVSQLTAMGVETIAGAQKAGYVRPDLPAPMLLVCFLGLVQTWFQQTLSLRQGLDLAPGAALDETYLECAWSVFAGGVLC